MSKLKKMSTIFGLQLFLFLLLLVVSLIQGSENYILFILFGLMTVILLLVCRRDTDQHSGNWTLLALAVAFYLLAQILNWIQSPEDITYNSMLIYIYFMPNLILLVSTFLYFVKNFSHWHLSQLILDMILLFVISLGMGSALFFSNMSAEIYGSSYVNAIIHFVIADLLIIVFLISTTISIKLTRGWRYLTWLIIAYLCFVLADLTGALIALDQIQDITFFSKMFKSMSFLFIGFSAFVKYVVGEESAPKIDLTSPDNFGKSRKTWVIIAVPLILFFLGYISINHIGVFLAVYLIYQMLSYHVQKTYMSKVLLKKEHEMKEALEELVSIRTEELSQLNKELAYKAKTDMLTGLNNRSYFLRTLEEYVELGKPFSLMYLDLNGFKVINDVHGHSTGDAVIQEIGKRFLKCTVNGHIVSRIGGDEFTVLVTTDDMLQLEKISEKIIEKVKEVIVIDDLQFSLGVSIGVARYPKDALKANELMKYADAAMYYAKDRGRVDKYVLYAQQLMEEVERRNRVELYLREARCHKDFELYYQPQFSIPDRKLIGMEALLRWKHATEGFISPGEFIPIAEETGIIVPLSYWVFEQAMRQIKEWNDCYHKALVMGVNLSPVSLDHITFFEKLKNLINDIGVSPSYLDFEITEHSAMNTSISMEEVFVTLSGLGVSVSIDDFGTGYSSLSYLKRFSVDRLKIAKELIDNIATDHDDKMIVQAIIMMCQGMGLATIAEGVETEEQLQILEEMNCESIQGYVLGKPVPANTFEELFLLKDKHSGVNNN